MTELALLSATEALGLFQKRAVSPVELTEALIERAEATEPAIGAFTYRCFDNFLVAARSADVRYVLGDTRPLEGLCIPRLALSG